MSTWPRISSVIKVWSALSLGAIAALLWFMRQQPPEGEQVFAGFSGQLMLATIEMGIPSIVGLLLFLLIGALLKRYLVH